MNGRKLVLAIVALLSLMFTVNLTGCKNDTVPDDQKFTSPTPDPSKPPRNPR